MTAQPVNSTPPATSTPDRVRAFAAPPETAPTDEHAAVWLEEAGVLWADYPTVPADDHMLPLVWGDGNPVPRCDLEARGWSLVRIADCCTEPLATFRVHQADEAAEYARVWLDNEGNLWADYPTADPAADLVLPLVWASEQTDSRRELQDLGYVFTRIGWSL